MSRKLESNETLVQIGVTALRAPDGTPLEGVPMYIIVDRTPSKDGEVEPLEPCERRCIDPISGILAKKFEQYVKAGCAKSC